MIKIDYNEKEEDLFGQEIFSEKFLNKNTAFY